MIKKHARSNGSVKGNKNAGVSEIIGDILILGITVVLFTSIFFFVNTIPTPNGQKYANFSASVDPFFSGSNPGNSYVLNITNQGGQSLQSSTTTVVVQVNQSTSVYQLSQGYSNLQNSQLWSAAKWNINQIWSVPISQQVYPDSIITVSIISSASNSVIWSNVLSPTVASTAIIIQSLFATPSPVSPGGNVTIESSIVLPLGVSQSLANISLNVSLLTFITGENITMVYNTSTGLYEAHVIASHSLQVGSSYPVTVFAMAPGAVETASTVMVPCSNTGLQIVTAAITPDPASPGSYFNITAFVRDSYGTYFNPPLEGSVNVTPTPPYPSISLTNISKGDVVTMHPSSVEGVFVAPGRVTLNATGYQTFAITAKDGIGNIATYDVTIFVFDVNSTGYPSRQLGPVSMSFSDFRYNPANSTTNYYPASAINLATVNPGYTGYTPQGIYFDMTLQNHNTTHDLYLDGLTNINLLIETADGFMIQYYSFLVQNTTQGSTVWNVTTGSSLSAPNYAQVPTPKLNTTTYGANGAYDGPANYSLNWFPGTTNSFHNPWDNTFILLPAAIGGVSVSQNLKFGSMLVQNSFSFPGFSFDSVAYNVNGLASYAFLYSNGQQVYTRSPVAPQIPAFGGGPFGPFPTSSNFEREGGFSSSYSAFSIANNSLSSNFLDVFGYLVPAGSLPYMYSGPASNTIVTSSMWPGTGIPFAQTLPFTAVYWWSPTNPTQFNFH